MAKGRKTGGRKPGSVNKTTAAVKDALALAFQGIGGVPQLQAWGEANPGAFYQLWVKLLPTEITAPEGHVLGVVILPAVKA